MSEAQLSNLFDFLHGLAYTSSELCLNNGLSRLISKVTTWGAIHLPEKGGCERVFNAIKVRGLVYVVKKTIDLTK